MEHNITHQDLLNELNSLRKQTFEFLKEQTINVESKVIKTSNYEIEKDFIPINLTEFKIHIYELFLKNPNIFENFNEFCLSINDMLKNYYDVFFILLSNNLVQEPIAISNLSTTPDHETTISLVSTYHKYILDNYDVLSSNLDIYNSIIKERKIKNFSLYPFVKSDNKLLGFLLLETYHNIKLSDVLDKTFSELASFISTIIEQKLLCRQSTTTLDLLSKTTSVLLSLTGKDFIVTNISDNIYSYGYFKFDLINKSWTAFIFFEDKDYFINQVNEHLNNNENNFNLTYRIITSYYTFEWISHNIIIIQNSDGSIQLDGILQNISKIKEYEISLENYNSILNIYNNALNDINLVNNNSDYTYYQKITSYLEILKKYFNFSTCILAHIENNSYNIYSIITNEYNFDNQTQLDITETLCEQTIKNNSFTLYADVDNYEELQNHPVYLTFQPKAYAGIPVYVDNKLWGTLSLIDKSNPLPPELSAILRDILMIVANNISHILHLKIQHDNWNANISLTNSKELIIQALINTYFDGIILTDTEDKIIQINQIVCNIFDFPLPSKVLIKKSLNLFINHIKELFENSDIFENFINEFKSNNKEASEIELNTIDKHKIILKITKIFNENKLIGTLWNFRKIEIPQDYSKQTSLISDEIKQIWQKENLDNTTVNDIPELKKELKEMFSKFTDIMLDFAENFFMNDFDAATNVAKNIVNFAIANNLVEVEQEAKILLNDVLPTKNFNQISNQYEKVNNAMKKLKELTKFIWYDEEEEDS